MENMLARPGLDWGIPTDRGDAMRSFYGEHVGLPYLEENEIIPGHDEVFYEMLGSWLKLNTSVDPLEPAVTGYRELLMVDVDATEPRTVVDPDGLPFTFVPPGHRGIREVGLVMQVPDVDAQLRFLADGMGAKPVGNDGGLEVGNTVIFVDEAPGPMAITPIVRRGLTMLTLIVNDLLAVHDHLLQHGGIHGIRASDDPGVPGRCQFSFLRDPNGNWIELVQFAQGAPIPPPPWENPTFEQFMAFRDHGTPA
jgi:catechol 2,3-dioxygenase-like lactoylglutathione lyase family enzyme